MDGNARDVKRALRAPLAGNGGCPRMHVELPEDVLEVRSDRRTGEDEADGDLAVRETERHEAEDLGLPIGERGGSAAALPTLSDIQEVWLQEFEHRSVALVEVALARASNEEEARGTFLPVQTTRTSARARFPRGASPRSTTGCDAIDGASRSR